MIHIEFQALFAPKKKNISVVLLCFGLYGLTKMDTFLYLPPSMAQLEGVVGWCEGVVYLMSLGRPTDIGLQLVNASYP